MGHCYGNDLRRRVVEAVTGGLSARGAAARFRVAPSTAIHWHRRWRETGSIEPDRQGQPPGSKLDAHEAFILDLVAQTKDMTLAEIGEKLAASHGVRVCPSTVWHFFAKRGLTHKKKDWPCIGAAAPGRARAAPALVRRPGRARSGTADLHRRDRRVDEDGAAAGMVAQRRTVPGLHTPWPLEDHHVDRRLAPLRPGGPDAPRRADAWGCLQGLCGTGPGTRTRPRRHRRHGQPARPQGRWYPPGHRSRRRNPAVSAALQSRLQPDRDGLRQTQGAPEKGRRQNRRRPVGRHCRRHRRLHLNRMRKLLRRRRI